MSDNGNDLSVSYARSGGPVQVEFFIKLAKAHWGVSRVVGTQVVQGWNGRTDDNVRDVLTIDESALADETSLAYSILYFAMSKPFKSGLTIEVTQKGKSIGKKEIPVDLTANAIKTLTGHIGLKAAQ